MLYRTKICLKDTDDVCTIKEVENAPLGRIFSSILKYLHIILRTILINTHKPHQNKSSRVASSVHSPIQ